MSKKATAGAVAMTADYSGIAATKVDAESVANALEKLGIVPATRASLAVRVKLLVDHFRQCEEKGQKVADCDNCGGSSTTADFDECPFCGVGEEADAVASAEPEPDPDVPPAEYVEEGDGHPAEPELATEIPSPPVQQSLLTEATAPAVVPPPSPVAGQALTPTAANKGGKGKKPKKGDAEPAAQVVAGEAQAALAVVEPNAKAIDYPVIPPGVISESMTKFERAVAEIQYFSTVSALGGYFVAKKLVEAEDSGVWKTKLGDDSKPLYRNFETFAHIELGMTGRYVRTMQKLVVRFSPEEFREIGPTKLRLVVEADESVQPDVLRRLKEGQSRRQVEREALGRKPGQGEQRAKSDRLETRVRHEPVSKPRDKSSAPKESGKLTLALIEGKKRFSFFAKPEKGQEAMKPAKNMGDVPWARLPIVANGAEVLITIAKKESGEWYGVVEVRRVTAGK